MGDLNRTTIEILKFNYHLPNHLAIRQVISNGHTDAVATGDADAATDEDP